MTHDIERVGTTSDRLGEGPLWDVAEQALYWVDSLGGTLHRLDWPAGTRRDWQIGVEIGSLALRHGGGAVLALATGLHLFDFETGAQDLLVAPEPDRPENRFNDGKTDRQGRFLAGTMHRTDRTAEAGTLYRLDATLELSRLEGGVIVSNGPCFSPDGRTFYFADSPRRAISAYDYDPATGAIANKRRFVDLAALASVPDGATVDAEGCLWTALVHTGEIARFDPDGRLMTRLAMPAGMPSSVMFGGPDLDILFVTSIRDSGTRQAPPSDRGAGGLFAVRGLGVRGLPEARFRG